MYLLYYYLLSVLTICTDSTVHIVKWDKRYTRNLNLSGYYPLLILLLATDYYLLFTIYYLLLYCLLLTPDRYKRDLNPSGYDFGNVVRPTAEMPCGTNAYVGWENKLYFVVCGTKAKPSRIRQPTSLFVKVTNCPIPWQAPFPAFLAGWRRWAHHPHTAGHPASHHVNAAGRRGDGSVLRRAG